MKFLNTKYERDSAKITTLIVVILVLLLFITGPKFMDPPEEYGVALAMESSGGTNNSPIPLPKPSTAPKDIVEDQETIEEENTETEEDTDQDPIEEVTEANTQNTETSNEQEKQTDNTPTEDDTEKQRQEDLLAQQQEKAERIKREEAEKEAKAKAEREAKVKAEKEAREKADRDAKAKQLARQKAEKEAKAKAAQQAKEAAAQKAAAEAAKAKANAKKGAGEGNKTVPFNLLEDAPIYPGCENQSSNTGRRQCMNNALKKFMVDNFDTNIATDLGLTGIHDIKIYFNIDKSGKVISIRAKASKPELEAEAKRVFNMLPKIKPGMQQGKPVTVKNYIPIKIKMGG